MDDDIYARATANRLVAADLFGSLTDEQWRTQSLCGAWTVRDLAGHFLMPLEVTTPAFLMAIVRARGSFDRAADQMSRRIARRPTSELVDTLRAKAGRRFSAPVVGPLGPFTDTCVHLRDAARPLGLDTTVGLDDWRTALDFLVSPRARRAFVGKGLLDGLRFVATDQDWSAGSGQEVSGPSEALAMAICGRGVAAEDLSGAGAPVLRSRLGG